MHLNKPLLFGSICALLLVAALVIATSQSFAAPNQLDGGAKASLRSASGSPHSAEATLHDASGKVIGKVKLDEQNGEVRVRVEASSLSAGFHGFHIHSVGQCVAPFTTAGGHFKLNDSQTHGHHAGDMPSLLVNSDGSGEARFTTDAFDIDQLFDADGSAIIVHAGPDNFANIPARYGTPDETTLATGDSGGRAACGVVERG
jgi:Cu-Zn family superoxide dismutase